MKLRLEKKRVMVLVLDGKKPMLEGEGIEGQCRCEGTLFHRGNPVGKASDKPNGGLDISGEEGRLLLFLDKWSFEYKGFVYCWFDRPEIYP